MLSIFKEIAAIVFPNRYTIEAISERQVNSLRNRGAEIGENVRLINANIDGIVGGGFLKIGSPAVITNATLLLHDASIKRELLHTKIGHIYIGNYVYIGYGAIILPNTTIGNKVIIGAGAVVAKDIPDNSVVVGNPCKIICTYDEYMEKVKQDMENSVCVDFFPQELFNGSHEELVEKAYRDGKCYTT